MQRKFETHHLVQGPRDRMEIDQQMPVEERSLFHNHEEVRPGRVYENQ
jgi:hypothetical protein